MSFLSSGDTKRQLEEICGNCGNPLGKHNMVLGCKNKETKFKSTYTYMNKSSEPKIKNDYKA